MDKFENKPYNTRNDYVETFTEQKDNEKWKTPFQKTGKPNLYWRSMDNSVLLQEDNYKQIVDPITACKWNKEKGTITIKDKEYSIEYFFKNLLPTVKQREDCWLLIKSLGYMGASQLTYSLGLDTKYAQAFITYFESYKDVQSIMRNLELFMKFYKEQEKSLPGNLNSFFQNIVKRKEPGIFSEDGQFNMDYGTVHETIANMVFLYWVVQTLDPNAVFKESGSYYSNHKGVEMVTTPDGFVIIKNKKYIVEFKCRVPFFAEKKDPIDPQKITTYRYIPSKPFGLVPLKYYFQVLQQLFCTNLKQGYFVSHTPLRGTVVIKFNFNEQILDQMYDVINWGRKKFEGKTLKDSGIKIHPFEDLEGYDLFLAKSLIASKSFENRTRVWFFNNELPDNAKKGNIFQIQKNKDIKIVHEDEQMTEKLEEKIEETMDDHMDEMAMD